MCTAAASKATILEDKRNGMTSRLLQTVRFGVMGGAVGTMAEPEGAVEDEAKEAI